MAIPLLQITILLVISSITCGFLLSHGQGRHDRRETSHLPTHRPIRFHLVETSSTTSDSSESINGFLNATSEPADVDDTNESALSLSSQAEQLKAEIVQMQQAIAESKEQQRLQEEAKVTKWIQDLLFVSSSMDEGGKFRQNGVQLLKTVDQVAQTLTDDRYSAEQVNKIFRRLSEGIPKERIEQSLERLPLLQLLVEGCAKLDCLERHENANKRWNGRVERDLRKKLFAMEWGIDLDDYSGEP